MVFPNVTFFAYFFLCSLPALITVWLSSPVLYYHSPWCVFSLWIFPKYLFYSPFTHFFLHTSVYSLAFLLFPLLFYIRIFLLPSYFAFCYIFLPCGHCIRSLKIVYLFLFFCNWVCCNPDTHSVSALWYRPSFYLWPLSLPDMILIMAHKIRGCAALHHHEVGREWQWIKPCVTVVMTVDLALSEIS